jgi:hypothetical protein
VSAATARRPVTRHRLAVRMRHVPAALAGSAAVALLGALAGYLLAGPAQAAGVAAGVGLVTASYLVSSLVVAWADAVDPHLVLPVGLGSYVLKFVLLFVVMAAIVGTGWAGTAAMGLGVIVGVVGWTSAQLWWTLRARIPYVQIDPD